MEFITLLTPFAPWHWVVVIFVVVLLFGGKKIPELMRGVGSGIKEFKDAVKEDEKKPEDSNKTENSN